MFQAMSGTSDDFDALVYGRQHPSTIQYIGTTIQNTLQNVGAGARNFLTQASQVFNYYHSEQAINRARAAIARLGATFLADDIAYLATYQQMITAQAQMRQYIMANPYIRQQYQAGRIEGYDGYYVDPFPNAPAEQLDDYQRVMDGVLQIDPDTGDSFYELHYGYDCEFKPKLDLYQQDAIISTWDAIKSHIKFGDFDPTSPTGSGL